MFGLSTTYFTVRGASVKLMRDVVTHSKKNALRHQHFSKRYHYKRKKTEPHFYLTALSPVLLSFSLFSTSNDSQKDKEKDKNKDIQNLVRQGKKMLAQNYHPKKAEMLYIQALHLALERKDRKVIAYIQDLLANLALHTNEYDKAEPLFRNVLQNLIATGKEPNDPAILEISLKLASIYASQGKRELAITGYTWCADTCRTNLKKMEEDGAGMGDEEFENSVALLGMILDSYGRYLFDHGNHQEALVCTMEAKSLCERLYGKTDLRTLIIYNDIGSVKSRMGKHEEAFEYVKMAVDAAENSGADPSEKAVFYTNLSMVCMRKGKPAEAEEAYKKALVEVSKTKDDALKKYVGSLANILVPDQPHSVK
uniref:tetratricopeptide repeat protein 19, mitochondrial-like isoform X1 n=1 Tax=Ciona intestinalis TaxID=7719 RepID=UPI0005218088|nr:tetratricopeptide repeat protein 19, mitochondrial-like isoform X1 [Ciona intestinalis]|eukprot:XP_009858930.1 tetratricopeptide repeat protein 19, mitochondrial-like isoform X1 [Ciona intestinalis]